MSSLHAELELNAPLVFVDLETTGPYPRVDSILQLAIIKLYPDWHQTEWSSYFNPGQRIPPEVIAIHGITDEKVAGAPVFRSEAGRLAAALRGCDFAGYSVDFDLRFLDAELTRAGYPNVLNGRVVDVLAIYREFHARSLADAVREYCGRDMEEGAHDARVDIRETLSVFVQQLGRYFAMFDGDKFPRTVEGLHRRYRETVREGNVDPDGKLYWRHGKACLNFSDRAGTPLEDLAQSDRGLLKWYLDKDFPEPFKRIVRDALAGRFPTREKQS